MKRFVYCFGSAALLVSLLTFFGSAVGRFDHTLPLDWQPIHVLTRLTFGPRPGDVDQVRRIGVDKWIDRQLHPESIPENPVLDSKLKPLQSLTMPVWQILDKYLSVP